MPDHLVVCVVKDVACTRCPTSTRRPSQPTRMLYALAVVLAGTRCSLFSFAHPPIVIVTVLCHGSTMTARRRCCVLRRGEKDMNYVTLRHRRR